MNKRNKTMPWLLDALAQETDSCILWPFSVQSCGYGDFRDIDEHLLAHRWICQQAHGEPPHGHDAAHSCGTRLCCNKRHLSWKTRRANLEDRREHGTMPEGENHKGVAILTAAEVLAIRAESSQRGMGTTLAVKYGVHPSTIYAARSGRSWKCL